MHEERWSCRETDRTLVSFLWCVICKIHSCVIFSSASWFKMMTVIGLLNHQALHFEPPSRSRFIRRFKRKSSSSWHHRAVIYRVGVIKKVQNRIDNQLEVIQLWMDMAIWYNPKCRSTTSHNASLTRTMLTAIELVLFGCSILHRHIFGIPYAFPPLGQGLSMKH